MKYGTIHEAKGRPYEAVCVVLPPELSNRPSAIAHWHTDTDDEARRVIYVGVTRAERFLAIAVHKDSWQTVSDIVGRHGLSVATVILDPIDVGPTLSALKARVRGTKKSSQEEFDFVNLLSRPYARN